MILPWLLSFESEWNVRGHAERAESTSPVIHWVAIGLLLVLFAILALGARQLSFTADEPAYIAGGYALWAKGAEAFSLLPQRGYPPLLAALEAALIYFTDPDIPVDQLWGWPMHYDSFVHAFEPYLRPLVCSEVVSRTPVMWLTVLLGAVVFRWAKDLWGQRAALLALFVLSFDPLLLAHGRLATTDAGVVMVGTVALYAAWRWSYTLLVSAHPSWGWALGTGALLGLTMLAKVSGPLWTLAAVLIMLVAMLLFYRKSGARSGDLHSTEVHKGKLWGQVFACAGMSLLIVWAGYGFTWGRVSALPFPVPAPAHWESFFYLNTYTSVYAALGRRWYEPQWWYFPLAFLIKNPLPLLIGLVVSWGLCTRRSFSPLRLIALGFFPLLYAAVAIGRGMNIGYRHMLPVHPFLYLSIGGGWCSLGRRMSSDKIGHKLQKWSGLALAVWYIMSALRVFPNELAYFNGLAGGPREGYRYLADSNLGWGQSARVLEAYLREHPEVKRAPPAAKFHPSPGRYVVNASYLYGLGLGDIYAYEWFRHQKPDGYVTYNWLLYDVPPVAREEGIDWFAQCEIPVAPLTVEAIIQGMGGQEARVSQDLRVMSFDCTQAWLYPAGGETAGIYALHHDLMVLPQFSWPSLLRRSRNIYSEPVPADPFIARHLESAHLSFEQAKGGEVPPFVLYTDTNHLADADGASIVPVADIQPFAVYPGPVETPPSPAHATPSSTPIPLAGGPLAFLGITYICEGINVEVETWWRVDKGPILRPFSIMAHLTTGKGVPLGVADGLGAWPLTLVTGDIIVQRHRFEDVECGPEDDQSSPHLWLRTGAYWLDVETGATTSARWAITGSSRAQDGAVVDALWIPLE